MAHRHVTLLLCTLGLLLLGIGLGHAETIFYGGNGDIPMAGYLPPATAGIIKVGCTPVLEIPGNGGGYTVAVRAEIVDFRMTEILSARLLGPVTVGHVRGKPTVYVGSYRLITAYPEDAAATGKTMRALAQEWADGVAAALGVVSPAAPPPTWATAEDGTVQ